MTRGVRKITDRFRRGTTAFFTLRPARGFIMADAEREGDMVVYWEYAFLENAVLDGLLLYLAVGGMLGGKVDRSALPAEYLVDYVRVYLKPA